MNSTGKRKRDDYASRLNSGGYVPQQDGSGDVTVELSLPQVTALSNCQTVNLLSASDTTDLKAM